MNGLETTEQVQERKLAASPRCPTCKKSAVYMGVWDADGYTLRCHGCLKAIGKCTC